MTAVRLESIGRGEHHVYVLHGILGSGRNWRSFARKLVRQRPDLTVHLLDQRNHGAAPPSEPPHTLAACAADVQAVIEATAPPAALVGHSFGGKVVLTWADAFGGAPVWVLDSPPGLPEGEPTAASHDALGVLASLRAAPTPAPSRQTIRDVLRARGLSEAIIAWLLTSTARHDDGWRWVYDLDGVDEMLADYFATDLWPVACSPAPVTLVKAERSDRWTADDLDRAEAADASGNLVWHVLPDAGHWLHVDNPEALLALLASGL